MTNLSFDTANKKTINTLSRGDATLAAPYDTSFKFNRIVSGKNTEPTDVIYSINPNMLLRKVSDNNFSDLMKITLVCKSIGREMDRGMWDILFNLISREGYTACLFLTDKDYTVLERSKVVVTNRFINYNMPVSRVQLNRVGIDTKIGIGIYDVTTRFTYVLLYNVASNCMVSNDVETDSGRTGIFPAVNCDLEQIWRVGDEGVADVVDVGDDIPDLPLRDIFVQYIVNNVGDIHHAYPWKPHYVPYTASFDRKVIEDRLSKEMEATELSRYEEFEEACRELYASYKPTSKSSKEEGKHVVNHVPIVEVAYLKGMGDSRDRILTKIVSKITGEEHSFMFYPTSMGDAMDLERHLVNEDIKDRDILEEPGVLLLSPETFGEESTLRYFYLNF